MIAFERQPKSGENEAVKSLPEIKKKEKDLGLAENDPIKIAVLASRKRRLYELRERYGLWEKGDQRLELVEKIIKRLCAATDLGPVRTIVSDSPVINAWALRGLKELDLRAGYFRSLGEWCQRHGQKLTEDKIAMTLAHELAHVEQGTEEQNGDSSLGSNEEEKQKRINKEYDADRRGLVILAQAGYNPREGIEEMIFWQSLGEGLPFFGTHPRSADRNRELYEMVYSSDTFLPNINKEPEEISPEVLEALVSEPKGKPGTIIYREEGRKKLGKIARQCKNFYDVVEIASVARMHDIARLARRERNNPEIKKRKAEMMVLENITSVLKAIVASCQDVNSKYKYSFGIDSDYNVPKNNITYIDLEFDYENDAVSNSAPALKLNKGEGLADGKKSRGAEESFEPMDDYEIEYYKKQSEEYQDEDKDESEEEKTENEKSEWDYVKGRIQEVVDLIDASEEEGYSLAHFRRNQKKIQDRGTPTRYDQIELGEIQKNIVVLENARKKLLEFKEKIDQTARRIDKNTVDLLLANVEIQGKENGKSWSEAFLTQKFVQKNSVDALIDWCLASGTAYFSNHRKESKLDEGLSSGIVSLDLFYEGYLPKEYVRELDLGLPADRKLFVERSMFDMAFGDVRLKFDGYNPNNLPEEFPIPHLEQVLDVLKERFTDRYALTLRIENARALANAVVLGGFKIRDQHQRGKETWDIVRDLDQKECEAVLRDFIRPEIDIESGANQIFLKETDISRNLNFYFFSASEKDFYRMVSERARVQGMNLPSAEEKLVLYREIFEKGDLDAVNSQIEADLIKIFSELNFETAEQLQTQIGPFLEQMGYKRMNFVDRIIEECAAKLDPREALKFYKMENRGNGTIWKYFQKVWDDENRKKASPKEQLEFFETFLEVLPWWDEYGGSGKFENQKDFYRLAREEQNKKVIQYYYELGREYFDLYRKVHHGTGILEPLKRLLKDGFLGFVEDKEDDRKIFLASQELSAEFASLNGEEWMKLAKYCAEIDGKQKKCFDISRKTHEENYRMDREVVQRIYKKALAYFNGGSYIDYFNGSKNRSLKENIGFILEYVPERYRDGVFRDLFKNKESEIKYFDLVTSEEFWPGGAVSILTPIAEKASYSMGSYLGMPHNIYIEENAKRYDPKQPSFLSRTKKSFDTVKLRIDLLNDYFKIKVEGGSGIIEDDSLSLTERMNIIFKLVPEKTDFRDWLLVRLEDNFFNAEWGILTQGPLIDIKNWQAEDQDIAMELYNFYERVIPTMVDAGQEQIWSRRAYELYCGLFSNDQEIFEDRLERILRLYPDASYVRDEVLLRLGDSDLIVSPEQSKKILGFLFAAQRRTADKKVLAKQNQLEQVSGLTSVLSRRERKDFVLWCIGAASEPPLTIRAIGGHYWVSFEDLPGLIFSGTPAERTEFFTRMLYGGNGVLDPKDESQKEIFDELLEVSFEKMFPRGKDNLDEKGRDVLKTVFITIMNEYDPYRRSRIFISMMEVLRSEGGSSVARRTRRLMEELGPVFIKAAQVLGEEEGKDGKLVMPLEFQAEFKKTKQNVKTFHRSAAFQTLEAVREFEESDENSNPIVSLEKLLAAASIKQGYVARQKDGSLVAEMVRRPSIGKNLEEDLRVLGIVVRVLQKKYEVPEKIDQRISAWVRDESNFENEINNYEEIGHALWFYGDRRQVKEFEVRLPKIYSHSAEHIRMEYIQGLSLEDLMEINEGKISLGEKLKKRGLDESYARFYGNLLGRVQDIKLQIFDSLMYQMLQEGVFHSDLHAGNAIINPEGEIVLIDLGSAGKVPRKKIPELRRFFGGFISRSGELVGNSLKEFVAGLDSDQQDRVMKTIEDEKLDNRDKFNRILMIISENEQVIDPGFEKFLKSLATGSYLTKGISEEKLAPTIFSYSQ